MADEKDLNMRIRLTHRQRQHTDNFLIRGDSSGIQIELGGGREVRFNRHNSEMLADFLREWAEHNADMPF